MVERRRIRKIQPYLMACAVACLAIAIGAGVLLSTRKDTKSCHIVKNATATLSGGVRFPLVSFGLQIYDNEETAYDLTRMALSVGYRNFVIDTGHRGTFARACVDSRIPRSELFVTAALPLHDDDGDEVESLSGMSFRKLMRRDDISGGAYAWTWKQGYKIMEAFSSIHYLDQILLDSYPGTGCAYIRGQWRALEEMVNTKRVRTLAVTNFSPAKLDCLLQDDSKLKIMPVVNQLPYNIAYHPTNTIRDNMARGILVQAWSPLGGGQSGKFSDNMRAVCSDIGKRHNKSFAQVALRWIVQKGAAFVTQSTIREHFLEDLNIFADFELSDDTMAILDALAAAG